MMPLDPIASSGSLQRTEYPKAASTGNTDPKTRKEGMWFPPRVQQSKVQPGSVGIH